MSKAKPSDEADTFKSPASQPLRLLAAFVANLVCLFFDSVGLLEWIPLRGRIQTVTLLSVCLVASVAIIYPTSLFRRRARVIRVVLLCLLGIGIEVCASVLILILFMIRNGLFPKN